MVLCDKISTTTDSIFEVVSYNKDEIYNEFDIFTKYIAVQLKRCRFMKQILHLSDQKNVFQKIPLI